MSDHVVEVGNLYQDFDTRISERFLTVLAIHEDSAWCRTVDGGGESSRGYSTIKLKHLQNEKKYRFTGFKGGKP